MNFLCLTIKSWMKIVVVISLVSILMLWIITSGKGGQLKFPGTPSLPILHPNEFQKRIPEKPLLHPTSKTFAKDYRTADQMLRKPFSALQPNFTVQESINAERVREMNDHCITLDEKLFFYKNRKAQKIMPRHFRHLYVNDKYKFIHCNIPKVACTNWKRLFLGLSGVSDPFLIPSSSVHELHGSFYNEMKSMRLSNFKPTEISYRLKHYTKAIVVRDPMERILSAFRNKLKDPTTFNQYFRKKYGSRILARYHQNLPLNMMAQGKGVSFEDFVRYLLHPMDFPDLAPWIHMNEHWERYFALCHPCFVRYNVVGKYETLDNDVKFILNKINATHIINWPKRRQHYRSEPTSQLIKEAFRNISDADIRTLQTLYYDDHKMFGYEFKNPRKTNVSFTSSQILRN